jgi:hypothetical protein
MVCIHGRDTDEVCSMCQGHVALPASLSDSVRRRFGPSQPSPDAYKFGHEEVESALRAQVEALRAERDRLALVAAKYERSLREQREEIGRLRVERETLTAKLTEANGALQALQVRMFDTVTTIEAQRDAARAQVRELLKVARAVRDYVAGKSTGATSISLAMALPPSMLEDPSDG